MTVAAATIPMLSRVTCMAALSFERPAISWMALGLLVGGLVLVAASYLWSLRARTQQPTIRLILLGLRLGAIFCLVTALLHPVWQTTSLTTVKPELAVVIDTSRSMAEPVPRTEADQPTSTTPPAPQPTRYAVARALAETLAATAGASFELRLFDHTGRPIDPANLPGQPTHRQSGLVEGLVAVQRQIDDQQLAGILLISDGRQVRTDPTTTTLDELHCPVFALNPAGTATLTNVADTAISSVTANRHALVGNAVNVVVDLATKGFGEAISVPVSILHGDRLVAGPIACPVRPGQTGARAELSFIPHRPGRFTYTARIGAAEGERELADNRQTFELNVRARPLTVLYIDGALRWEGKFTRQVLADDPDVNVVSAVRTARPGAGSGSQGLLLAEQLNGVDVVILGDVEATYFSSSELAALGQWVTDAGGGLLLGGGYQSFGPQGFGRTALSRVLPVEFSASANPQIEQPFSLKLTEIGREHPIFNLTGDRVRDAAFYQSLPELLGCTRIAAVKPAAQVLAVNPRLGAAGGFGGLPVMITQETGEGRTMVLAVDSTWRWRMVVGGYTGDAGFYQRFWGQTIRWLAGESESSNRHLVLSTDRYRYQPDQPVTISINWIAEGVSDQLVEPSADISSTEPLPDNAPIATEPRRLVVQAVDESGRSTTLNVRDLSPGRWEATYTPQTHGRIDLHVTAESGDAAAGDRHHAESAMTAIHINRPNAEQLDTRPDPAWLARLAQRSGGRVVDAEQAIEILTDQPVTAPRQVAQARTLRLWRNPYLAGLFFLLICTEWAIRRRARLP